MPEAPAAPSSLLASFDEINTEATLDWEDNSHTETRYIVRRKAVSGRPLHNSPLIAPA